ncbi:hypothetical protein YC2023_060311 [Brassica napus]
MLKKQHHAHRLPASAPQPPLSDTEKRKGKEVSTQETLFLEGPPGFPPMFPELSKEQQQSAMLYVSHADPTERRARIERVNQSIQEKREKELNYRPAFTTDLLKGVGMVLCYNKEGEQLQYIYSKGAESSPKTRSLPGQREIDEVSSGQSSTHSLNAGSPTGFCIGASSKPSASGTISTQKKPRNRPPAWKRRLRLLTGASTKNGNGENSENISEGMAKRKATYSTGEGYLTYFLTVLQIGTGTWSLIPFLRRMLSVSCS